MYSKAPKSCALKGLASARDSLLGNARISLVKSLLSCPANLQWKVWLAGARLELSAGSLAKARRSPAPPLSVYPVHPISSSNDHHVQTPALISQFTASRYHYAHCSAVQFNSCLRFNRTAVTPYLISLTPFSAIQFYITQSALSGVQNSAR